MLCLPWRTLARSLRATRRQSLCLKSHTTRWEWRWPGACPAEGGTSPFMSQTWMPTAWLGRRAPSAKVDDQRLDPFCQSPELIILELQGRRSGIVLQGKSCFGSIFSHFDDKVSLLWGLDHFAVWWKHYTGNDWWTFKESFFITKFIHPAEKRGAADPVRCSANCLMLTSTKTLSDISVAH